MFLRTHHEADHRRPDVKDQAGISAACTGAKAFEHKSAMLQGQAWRAERGKRRAPPR